MRISDWSSDVCSSDLEGFGQKVREWNSTALLQEWRVAWADHVNERLAELDIDARIDHRTLEAQGIDLEPKHKIGPAATRMPVQGLEDERVEDQDRIGRENGEKNLARPESELVWLDRHHIRRAVWVAKGVHCAWDGVVGED